MFDPKSTRRSFTEGILGYRWPPNADETYLSMANTLRTLFYRLAYDQGMAENLDQKFTTPVAYENKVYFMWDFVGQTLSMLHILSSSSDGSWSEVHERAMLARDLITDTTGRLDATCPDARGWQIQFNPDIIEVAGRIKG